MVVPNLIEQFTSPNFTNLLVTFIIPFFIFFTILFWVLLKTKIFNRSISLIIALGLTIMIYVVNPGNVFQFLASYLFQIGVAGIIITLVGLIAIFFWNLIKGGTRIAGKIGKTEEQKLQDLMKEREKLLKRYYSGGIFQSTGKRMELLKEMEEKEKEIERLQHFLRARYKK